MKKIKSLSIITLIFTFTVVLISCETEENLQEINNEEIDANIIAEAIEAFEASPNENEKRFEELGFDQERMAKALVQTNIRRYYHPSKTVHTYYSPETRKGHRVGNLEGTAFRTAGVTNGTTLNTSSYVLALLFLHPQQTDFVISTSLSEDRALRGQGWRTSGPSGNQVYLYKTGGNGRKPLYRFYKASSSDHLFTKNYNEGINNGFAFEGVVGWVY